MRIEPLPYERWAELGRALEESRSDEPKPKPGNSIIIAAIDGEKIIGCIGAEKTWVVSPFWIQREFRGNGLARELAQTLADYNVEGFREMCATTSPHVERLIHQMGFTPVLGQLWRR